MMNKLKTKSSHLYNDNGLVVFVISRNAEYVLFVENFNFLSQPQSADALYNRKIMK